MNSEFQEAAIQAKQTEAALIFTLRSQFAREKCALMSPAAKRGKGLISFALILNYHKPDTNNYEVWRKGFHVVDMSWLKLTPW